MFIIHYVSETLSVTRLYERRGQAEVAFFINYYNNFIVFTICKVTVFLTVVMMSHLRRGVLQMASNSMTATS